MIPHTIRPLVRNVLDVSELVEAEESWLSAVQLRDREKEQAGAEETRPAPLPEKD